MQTRRFQTGSIREISFDSRTNHLELTWQDQSITAYRPVPLEIVDRLCKAPNPATYFEDRIAEEYPKVQALRRNQTTDAAKKLNDLFGG